METAPEGARPRRALPADEAEGHDAATVQDAEATGDAAAPAAKRARVEHDALLEEAETVAPATPRRGVDEEQTSRGVPSSLRPLLVVLGAGLSLAVVVTAIYLSTGSSDPVDSTVPSPPATTEAASPSPSPSTSPSASPTNTLAPSASASPSPSPGAEGSVLPSLPVQGALEIDDAKITVPSGWELYADQMVDDSRRLVRLREPVSDIRAQFVTLTSIDDDLNAACQALVKDQSAAYEDVTPALVSPIGLNSTAGSGVTCGFTGTRTSDGVSNTVTFTIVQRSEDEHSLVLRSTIPSTIPADDAKRAALFGLNCEASTSFGLPLPLC